jgi:cytochrome b pre-mRNA-processing protein 3
MILNLFRRGGAREVVSRLYLETVDAARQPAFFGPAFGVADTVEGRFELLTLHACLLLRRLSALPAPAPDLGQDLANRIFQGFDMALRELGVGDLTVPKRMKAYASDFGGRSKAYGAALDRCAGPDAAEGLSDLRTALARNVYGSPDPAHADRLADYVLRAAKAIEQLSFSDFDRGPVRFPQPTSDDDVAGDARA